MIGVAAANVAKRVRLHRCIHIPSVREYILFLALYNPDVVSYARSWNRCFKLYLSEMVGQPEVSTVKLPYGS